MKVSGLVLAAAVCCLLPFAEAIFFVEQPASVEAVVGQPVSFSCNVNTSLGTFDRWLFQRAGSDLYSALEGESTTTLHIASFAPSDAGDYRCQVSIKDPPGTALSQPATASYFSGSFVEHPKDFNSYVLITDSSNFMRRPVIAFQCTYDADSTIRPRITWQKCHSTGDCFDILETTDMVEESHIQKYVYFQSGYTGYFQIQDRNNESLNGTRYRCKASSPLPRDTAEVFSEPAKVIFHAADVTVPDDLPTFRTIPQEKIVLSPEDSIGVLACSIQRYNDTTELVIRQPGGGVIVTGFFFFPPKVFGYSYIPQANLLINLTDFEKPSDFVSETYVCSLLGAGIEHRTKFVREEPIMFTVTEKAVWDTLVEDEGGTINFNTVAGYTIDRVLKDGRELALSGSNTPEIQYSMSMESGNTTHTLTIPAATKEYEGIYQFEAEGETGRIVQYHHVTVKYKARSISAPSQSTTAKVTQDLSLMCSAIGNADDSHITFTWLRDNVAVATSREPVSASDGIARHTFRIPDIRESNGGDYVCSPTNDYGGYNTSTFTVQVEKYDPPTGVTVRSEEDDIFTILVTWDPVDVMADRYPGAHVDKYIVVLTVITAMDEQEMPPMYVLGSETSTTFNITSAALRYRAVVKAVTTDGEDITDFSTEASALVTRPTVVPSEEDKARSISAPSQSTTAKVTQDLSLMCSAIGNADDSHITFTWLRDNVAVARSREPVSASDGIARHTFRIPDIRESNGGDYVCSPTNDYGGYNTSTFTVQVEKYDPPTGVTVRSEDDDIFAIVVTWNPIDVMADRYPGAQVDKFIVVLTVITATDEQEMPPMYVLGSETSTTFNINTAALSYSAVVKAVTTDGEDITDFSTEASALVTRPTVEAVVPSEEEGIPVWGLFLMIFSVLLLILGGLLLFCLLLFLRAKRRKGRYNVQKKEEEAADEKVRNETDSQESETSSQRSVTGSQTSV